MNFYYTYVLVSEKDNQLYIGYSSDLKQRLRRHNKGEIPATKYRRPLKLIYYEAHLSQKDATRREKYFKSSAGKTTLKTMLQDFLGTIR